MVSASELGIPVFRFLFLSVFLESKVLLHWCFVGDPCTCASTVILQGLDVFLEAVALSTGEKYFVIEFPYRGGRI